MTTPEVFGAVAPGFGRVADVFARDLGDRESVGGALHVRVDGEAVVDLWAGSARRGQAWLPDTPSVIFSCTKGLVSILIGELVNDGSLDLDAPVSHYWPEFSGHGKERLSVRGMLAHRAGLPTVRGDLSTDDVTDWDRITGILAQEPPFFEPGSGHVYHPLTFGFLAGEIVRRVTGVPVGEFFAQRIARPLDVDAWIGVPADEIPRVAELTLQGEFMQAPEPPENASDLERYGPRGMTLGHAISERFADPGEGFNDPRILQAVLPGAGGVASARALGTIWSATVSDKEATALLSPSVIEDMRREQSAGEPVLPAPAPWPRWGSGFMLPSEARPMLSESSFGHDGLGGQLGFADPDRRVGFGYVTNDLRVVDDSRSIDLVTALRASIG